MAKFFKMLCIPATHDDNDRSEWQVYTSSRQGAAPAGWKCIAVLGYFEKAHRIRYEEE